MHLLRASDGSHYVAFSAEAPADLTPDEKLALYVRLEPRPTDPPSTQAPRSAVEDWLRGERSDPLPMRAARVVFDSLTPNSNFHWALSGPQGAVGGRSMRG